MSLFDFLFPVDESISLVSDILFGSILFILLLVSFTKLKRGHLKNFVVVVLILLLVGVILL